ncbi:MAG: hypothetical protein LBJ11_05685 [Oscillospiraceae bacterium]|nr:hypothetical protein [Oscillospiraceae bacterium]
MDTIRSWATCVALSALAGGLVWLMAPKGSVQKAVRTVVAVFLLAAFLSPFFQKNGLALDFSAPEPDGAPTIGALQDALHSQTDEAIAEKIREVLESQGVDMGRGQISVRTDILSDGSINIEAVTVRLPAGGYSTEKLRTAIREATGLDVDLIVGTEQEMGNP